jgi:multiple sugar transport system permease protein
MGYASALAWVLFAIVLACTLIVFKTSGRWVFYRAEAE